MILEKPRTHRAGYSTPERAQTGPGDTPGDPWLRIFFLLFLKKFETIRTYRKCEQTGQLSPFSLHCSKVPSLMPHYPWTPSGAVPCEHSGATWPRTGSRPPPHCPPGENTGSPGEGLSPTRLATASGDTVTRSPGSPQFSPTWLQVDVPMSPSPLDLIIL